MRIVEIVGEGRQNQLSCFLSVSWKLYVQKLRTILVVDDVVDVAVLVRVAV